MGDHLSVWADVESWSSLNLREVCDALHLARDTLGYFSVLRSELCYQEIMPL